ncbi:Haloacid dehalogenase domain protein hydrolase [Halothece sp. PCC 7418]|uniref:HAD family hydrolase n=1 Tax=Halothece sp. (strain PCC 7418) TaxID=65093 RepID=UPI0002A05C58|nr:HAD family hydrolase [Halothece sp. PCC 7418]AFZ45250.1 Haloacid dehalogenase domain protein hydrolase [Halothece sp. PCC 7418]
MVLETIPKTASFSEKCVQGSRLHLPKSKESAATLGQVLTVFCDFDGPLVDVSDRYYNTYQIALDRTCHYYRDDQFNLIPTPLTKEQFWQMKQERVCDQEIALRSGLQLQHIPYFVEQVRAIVNEPFLLRKDKFHQGVNWALALLHSQGVRLVVVTLRCQEQVTQLLRNYGLLRLLSGVYGTDDETAAYPNNIELKTALLKQALAEQGNEHVCMVGDTEADVLAAQALGIRAIALTCGIRSHNYLQQFEPDHIESNLLNTAHRIEELCLN